VYTTEVREYIAILLRSEHYAETAERVRQKLLKAGYKDDDFVPHCLLVDALNDVLSAMSVEREKKVRQHPAIAKEKTE